MLVMENTFALHAQMKQIFTDFNWSKFVIPFSPSKTPHQEILLSHF